MCQFSAYYHPHKKIGNAKLCTRGPEPVMLNNADAKNAFGVGVGVVFFRSEVLMLILLL